MAVTQKSYLDSNSSVKAARKKLDKAKAELSDAKKAKAGLPASAGSQLATQIEERVKAAQKELDKQALAVAEVETKAKDYFAKNEPAIQEKAATKEKKTAESNVASVEAQIARMKAAGLDTTQVEASLARSKEKNVVAEQEKVTPEGKKGKELKPDDFAGLIKSAPEYIKKLSGPERKFLAQSLNDALGTELLVSELVDPTTLLGAYQSAITGAQARYNTFKDITSVDQFLAQKRLETAAIKAAGGSGKPFGTISSPTQAKATINSVVTSLLGREATDKEIASITKKLTAAQKANPLRTVNGMTVGGLNAEQFITDIIKSGSEFTSKKQAKEDLVARGIEDTLNSNGISYKPGQVQAYADRVKNGEDLKVIEAEIRDIASLGQPDAIKKLMAAGTDLETIYAPYKRTMAASLGINPDTITLDDPTLRMAIGPDKEMSLYDYKKAIRQDNRWKYSQEANDEVTNMISQVKRDFGFMG